jgi:hypothetical protein
MCINLQRLLYKQKFDKISAYQFILGYFIIGFILFFWADVSFISFKSLSLKLIWGIVGLIGAIFIGVFSVYADGKRKKNTTRKQIKR